MISIYVKNIDHMWFGVATDEKHIFATTFNSSQSHALQNLLCSIPFDVPFQTIPTPSNLAKNALQTLKNIYEGKDTSTKLTLQTKHLSTFDRKILNATSLIPRGYVTSYGAIANAAGGSPRAVGHVMAKNPFPPIIPCHGS